MCYILYAQCYIPTVAQAIFTTPSIKSVLARHLSVLRGFCLDAVKCLGIKSTSCE